MAEKFLRAILIDPERRAIEVFSIRDDKAVLGELHARIGAATLDSFVIADHDKSWDHGWVDDGGLNRGEPIHAFLFEGNRHPFAGRCVLTGVEKDGGASCDARFPLEALRGLVTWLGVIRPEVMWDKVGHVERAIVTYARVKA